MNRSRRGKKEHKQERVEGTQAGESRRTREGEGRRSRGARNKCR